MPDGPQTWHHGLIARWWAEFNVTDPAELDYYRGSIERFGQPALDLACGTGRLLIPLLEAGLDVDGADVSKDMLSLCSERAAIKGLSPNLHHQAMHQLALARRFRTIYVCDSFGIGGRRSDDRAALRRIHDHLEPGGALVFSHDLPYGDADQWSYWLPDRGDELPQEWPGTGTRRTAANGDEIELIGRLEAIDPVEQRVTMGMRPRLWHAGELVREEEHRIQISMYFRQELVLLLEQAGFQEVTVEGPYTGRPATAGDAGVVIVARA